MSAPRLVYREDFVRETQRLRAEGWSVRKIAEHFDRSYGAVQTWLNDPDLSKQRARRARYQGTCEDCGARTDGSNGKAKAPTLCNRCYRARREPPHGTTSRYQGGCRCDDCRRATREAKRELKGKMPPSHGYSGYVNYGCRCDICRAAHSDYEWQNPGRHRRWAAKVKGAEPPRHGYSTAYKYYGCRCDECRAWAREDSRRRYLRQKASAA